MKSEDFIKKAKIVDFTEIATALSQRGRTTLDGVKESDKCYMVKSGKKLQFWVTRDKYLMSVNCSMRSPFCVCIDIVY